MSASYPRAAARFGAAALERRAAPLRARRRAHRTVVRLWLPLTPLAWLLAPFALLLAPLAWLAPPPFRPVNAYAAALAVGRVLTLLGGTFVDVDCPDALVRIRIL
jgi:hypothetical protein